MAVYTSKSRGAHVELPSGAIVQFTDGIANVDDDTATELNNTLGDPALAYLGIEEEPDALVVVVSPVPHGAGGPSAPEQGQGRVLSPEDEVIRSPIPRGAGAPESPEQGVGRVSGPEDVVIQAPVPAGAAEDGDGEDVSLDGLNVAQLRKVARQRGHEVEKTAKRHEILALLKPVSTGDTPGAETVVENVPGDDPQIGEPIDGDAPDDEPEDATEHGDVTGDQDEEPEE